MSSRSFLFALFVLALGVRLAAVAFFRDFHTVPHGIDSADDVHFYRLGHCLAHGHGYRFTPEEPPTSVRAPGFPFALAPLFALVGDTMPVFYGGFCVLGALTCLLTYGAGRDLLGESAARWAGILNALYVPHAQYASLFLSENLFVPLQILGVWLVWRGRRQDSLWQLGLAGLLLGYATLTRPFVVLLLPIYLVLFAWQDWRERRLRVFAALVFAGCFVAVVIPWLVRNYEVHGQFVLVATNGGSTLYGANNDLVLTHPRSLGYWVSTTELPHRDLIDAQPTEYLHDKMEWKLGMDWIRANWMWMPVLGLLKLARCFWLPEYETGGRLLRIITYVPYALLWSLAAWRIVRNRRYWSMDWLYFHASMLALLATVLVFGGQPRFREGNTPMFMIYAAVGLGAFKREENGSSELGTVDGGAAGGPDTPPLGD
jgi:4-amino-4-deoxy-L-arabinose transferase-like glycosyltransferase